ncbi:apolipoprotein A-Ib [Hippoglossus hippoglossus]|uniref:apolipoprotein A-Ib n=1 Tax=Hippoglossus hippoglossus TaxID=8267 RepID=UPI00148E2CCA|nr:apolipoprotein A-Ib [Hippoglossus hippoglossus]XP_035011294.1 apolipoprotein A-Ib [Hippoglossus stenolepis]
MKFVALALALLLAVGSHAASMQADAPNQLQHVRSLMEMYMTQLKDSANKVLDQLDNTEYSALKVSLSHRLDEAYVQIKALQTSVSPITDNVFTTIAEATADFRASVDADIKALKADIEPKRVELRRVITEHIEEYRRQLEPIIKDYHTKHSADMEALKIKLEPVVEAMKTSVAANVEETKTALMPILESVRAKLSERLENLKEMATPYVEEYKDQLKSAYSQAQAVNPEDITALREKIAPMAEEVKAKVQEMFEAIAAAFNKS